MSTSELLGLQFHVMRDQFVHAARGISLAQLYWHPRASANHIGFLL